MTLSREEHEHRRALQQEEKREKTKLRRERIEWQRSFQEAVRKICADRNIKTIEITLRIPAGYAVFARNSAGFSEDSANAVAKLLGYDNEKKLRDAAKPLPPAHKHMGTLRPSVHKGLADIICKRMADQDTSLEGVAREAGVTIGVVSAARQGLGCSIENLHKVLQAVGEKDPQAVIDGEIERYRAAYQERSVEERER